METIKITDSNSIKLKPLGKIPTSYEFFSDPGHGWLKVPITAIFRLDLLTAISPYSYHRDGWAYLEEDCDAGLYLLALKVSRITPKIRERVARKKQSRIREYNRFPSTEKYYNHAVAKRQEFNAILEQRHKLGV